MRRKHSKIALVYFSATNVTHTYAGVMKEALLDHGCEVRLFNVTAHASRREPLPIDDFDGFIFGLGITWNHGDWGGLITLIRASNP